MMAKIVQALFGTFRRQIISGMILFCIVAIGGFMVDLATRQQGLLIEQKIKQAESLSQSIAVSAEGGLLSRDFEGLQEIVDAQKRYPELAFAMILDNNGMVVAHTDRQKLGLYVTDILAKNQTTLMYNTPKLIDMVSPIVVNNNRIGWVRVGIDRSVVTARLETITQDSILYGLLAILIASLLAYLMGSYITRRIRAIQSVADAVRSGDMSRRADITGEDEAATLARQFNTMLDTITESESKFHAVAVSAQDAIIILDNDGNIAFWNNTAEKIFGYIGFEAIGKNLHFLLAPKRYHEKFAQGFSAFQTTGEGAVIGKTLELTALKKDGTEFPVELSISSVKLKDKWNAIGILRDITERKQAEESARRSNELLEKVFSITHIMYAYLDKDFNFIRVNEAYAKANQQKSEYFTGKNHFALFPHEENEAIFRQVIKTGIPYVANAKPFSFPDHPEWGVTYWDWTLKPIKDANGNVEGLLFSLLDVTDEKKAEQEIVEKERHSQSLLRLSKNLELAQTYMQVIDAARDEVRDVIGYQNLWVFLLTEDKKYAHALFASGAMSEATLSEEGAGKLTIKGDKMLEEIVEAKDIVVVEDARIDPRTDKKMVELMGNRTIINVPIIFFDKHIGMVGTGTYGDEGVRPPTKAEKEYLSALASHLAVTLDRLHLLAERKKVEEALQMASLYNRSLIEASLDPLVTISPDGKITDVNAATEEVTGRSRDELVGTDFSDYFYEPEKAKAAYHQVFETGFIRDYPLEIMHKYGYLTPVIYNASVYRDEGGAIIGVFAAARDVTEQKKAEREILKLNRIYRMLSDCNQTLVRTDDENKLIAEVCRIITEEGGYMMVWVGYAQYNEDKTIKPMAHAGYEDGYLSEMRFSWGNNIYGNASSGIAIREKKHHIIRDFSKDDTIMPWKEAALKRGYSTNVSFPLIINGEAMGALSIYGATTNAFNEDELMLLQELASDLAFGIATIRVRNERERVQNTLNEAQRIAHLGSWHMDIATNEVVWSEELYKLYGFDPALPPPLYTESMKLFTPESWEKLSTAIAQAVEKGIPYELELETTAQREGGRAWMLARGELVRDARGAAVEVRGIVMDITKRKLAEESLRENEHFLDNTIENIPNMLFVKEAATLKFIRFNKTGEELLGYSKDELIGKNDYDLFPKEQADFFTSKDREIISSGKLMDIPEEPINTKYLGLRYLHTKKIPVFADDGTPMYLIGISEDITELREAREALKQSEKHIRTMIETSPMAMGIADKDGNITYVNTSFIETFGYTREDVPHVNVWFEKAYPDKEYREKTVTKWRGAIDEFISSGAPIPLLEANVTGKDGSLHIIDLYTTLIDSDTFVIFHDVTELKRSEEALKHMNEELEIKVRERTAQLEVMNKELEAFTYSVSHDLRAPLRSIDGFSAAVIEDYGDKVGKDGKEYLQRARSAAQKMGILIDDLLSLSRLTRGELNKTSVNLGDIAADVIRNLRETEPDRVVDVIIAENMTAEADPHFMEIVFTNLLNNAWKFTSKKDRARIEFGFTQKDGNKVYYVKDNGAGFNMSYAKKLFQPFQRLHTVEEFPGTGIGLATVYRVIKKHGGDVWAEGEVGQGATFYFTLGE